MTEGTTTIRCPHCGYPYPMTRLQLEVYIGRSMGCMHCGKSFPVSAPAPAQTDDLLLAGAALIGTQTAHAASPTGAASFPPLSPVGRPAEAPASPLGSLGVAAAVVFVVMAAAAAVVGYSGSSENAIKSASRSQTPMMLLHIAFGIAVVGAMLGVAGIVHVRRQETRTDRRPRLGAAGTALILCLSEVVVASLLALMVMPRLNSGLAESHRAACQTNLQSIGYALIASASERVDGRFPDSLGDLVKRGVIGADSVVCPADEHPAAPDSKTPADKAALIDSGEHATYVYLGKAMAMRATGGRRVSTHTVLAYEPPGLHGDPEAFHILFADGTVLFAEKEMATKILVELKAGQNPPPTAEAIKP